MVAMVCHGLQSCLESQLVESRTLRLKFPTPKPLPSQPIDLALKNCFWDSNPNGHCDENSNKAIDNNNMGGGWSFLQALPNVSSQGTKDKDNVYVHPQVKHSKVLLCQKSLEMCTENLGNETGTDIIDDNINLISSLSTSPSSSSSSSSSSDYVSDGDSPTWEQVKSHQLLGEKKVRTRNFPPPLTTIRGSESLRVRPHREDGRLVIEAVKVPSSASCFQAERSHGRLRLCFLTSPFLCFDPQEAQENEPNNEGLEEEFESEMKEQTQEEEEDEEEEDEEEYEEKGEEEDTDGCGYEELNANSSKVGGEIRQEKYERPSRCKEGDHENNYELLNWEPLWVATS
ncbi:hypothetical protein L6164_012703 [Bauhinia variegata]|uniref:Uncharacterized protein n=1 Tax=Bauhinia variegata TaxID=167791 RepID=A0ACB9P9W5_BAUVA|nr:hypothetical protein L6164_012703 [Bauhinia variegata]